jgi:hypothetical protein
VRPWSVKTCSFFDCPIIANSHLQLVLVIVDLRFDPPRLCVPEGVAQRFAGNAVNFVARYGVKIPRSAFHLNGKFEGILVRLVGREPFTESFQGHGEIVGLCRGHAQTLHGVATLGDGLGCLIVSVSASFVG